MILATLEDPLVVETLLNNLSEADFDLGDVSVLMNDPKQGMALGQNSGPLSGIQLKGVREALIKLGVSEEGAKQCQEAVTKGSILLVMKVAAEYSPAAEEIFQDHSAQLIKG